MKPRLNRHEFLVNVGRGGLLAGLFGILGWFIGVSLYGRSYPNQAGQEEDGQFVYVFHGSHSPFHFCLWFS